MMNKQRILFHVILFFFLSAFVSACGTGSSDSLSGRDFESDPPIVSQISPAASATGASLNSKIVVRFNDEMDESTLTENTFTLSKGGSAIAGTIVTDNDTSTFTPTENLSASSDFVVVLSTGITDKTGNNLAQQYSWNFKTGTTIDNTAPSVFSVSPADSSTNVLVGSSIIVTFNEAMTPSSITTNTVGTTCSGSLQISTDNFSSCVQMSVTPVTTDNITYTVTPVADLTGGADHRVCVTTVAEDAAGNTMAHDYLTGNGFTTGYATSKEITSFKFLDADNTALSSDVNGAINETNKTVGLTVPDGTDVTALVPTIEITGAAVSPASGTAANFTNAVTYTVTAEDNSAQDYTVTVTISSPTSNCVLDSGILDGCSLP